MILCEVLVEVAVIFHVCGTLAVSVRVDIIIWGGVDEFHDMNIFFFPYMGIPEITLKIQRRTFLNLDFSISLVAQELVKYVYMRIEPLLT